MAEGVADVVRRPGRELAERIARQYGSKYGRVFGYRPKAEGYMKGYVFRVRPTTIIAFDVKLFETSATRFTFPSAPRS